MEDVDTIVSFLETVHPYDSLPQDEMARVALPAAWDYQEGAPS